MMAAAGLPFALLPALQIKRVMDAIQRAAVAPQVEIAEPRAARRQVFRNRPPLAPRAQNIHDPRNLCLQSLLRPFIASRPSTRRLLPPRLAGGINGPAYADSSPVGSLGYRHLPRPRRPRLFAVHTGGLLESRHPS